MEALQQVWLSVREYLPNLMAAVAILIVGWIVARVVAAVVKAGLRRTTIDNRIAEWLAGEERGKRIDVEAVFGKVVFYTIMVFVLVAFLQTVGLTQLTEPLNALLNQVFAFAPRVLGGVVLLVVAWVVASALRMLVSRVLGRTKLDQRVGEEATGEGQAAIPLSKTLGEAVYWLVFLLFLPAILGALALQGLLEPVQGMVNKVLEYLPNVISAGAIVLVGWFVARVVQRIVGGLLAAVGVDRLSENFGFDRALGDQRLSQLLALVLYIMILIPVLISGLNALGLDAVTQPASNMLDTLLGALPGLFAAALVLGIAYVIGRVVSGLVSNLLSGAGFDNLLQHLGIKAESMKDGRSPSAIAGYIVLVAVMFFALIEAFGLLGFETMSDLLAELLVFGSHVLVALVIFAAGLYLAAVAGNALQAGGATQARLLAYGARAAILVLAGAMALRQLGVADEIITLAFGLTLGAIAVAVAVAFGIGGRDLAARQLEQWHRAVRGDSE